MATCNINSLLDSGKCFACLTSGEMDIIELQLLCEILSAGGGTGGSGLSTGMIIMWSGTIASIPSGFALCNGANGTPDLRNRFVVCADADNGGAAKTTITGAPLQSGGSNSHSHAVGSYTTQASALSASVDNNGGGTTTDVALIAHTHAVVGTSGATTAIATFYALAYIMKL